MALSTTSQSVQYTGNASTTAFPVTFKFINSADLVVTYTTSGGSPVTWALGTDYTVTGADNDAGGTLTATVAPDTASTLLITRHTPITQLRSLPSQGPFTPAVLEDGLDQGMMALQDVNERRKADIATLQARATTDEAAITALQGRATTDEGAINGLQSTLNSLSGGTYTPALSLVAQAMTPGGRLTLSTGVPVPIAGVLGAGIIYYTQHKSRLVPLYDGSNWSLYTFPGELSADYTSGPAAWGNSSNYDLFVWNNAGVLTLSRGPAWTSDTARGFGAGTTSIAMQDGRWVNAFAITSGPASLRGLYVGTVRTNGSAQLNDDKTLRHLWNAYNRVPRHMRAAETADTWTYGTATLRQANANAANQLDFVRGLDEESVSAEVVASVTVASGHPSPRVAIGLDSTSAKVSTSLSGQSGDADACLTARFDSLPGLGHHTLTWLEAGTGTGVFSWLGDNGGSFTQSGISGLCYA